MRKMGNRCRQRDLKVLVSEVLDNSIPLGPEPYRRDKFMLVISWKISQFGIFVWEQEYCNLPIRVHEAGSNCVINIMGYKTSNWNWPRE